MGKEERRVIGVSAFEEVFDAGRQHSWDVSVVLIKETGTCIPQFLGNVAESRQGVSQNEGLVLSM